MHDTMRRRAAQGVEELAEPCDVDDFGRRVLVVELLQRIPDRQSKDRFEPSSLAIDGDAEQSAVRAAIVRA